MLSQNGKKHRVCTVVQNCCQLLTPQPLNPLAQTKDIYDSHVISPVLQVIYQSSLDIGQLPLDWKHALVSLVFKKGSRSNPSNYRPISLTCVLCKTLEHIICSIVITQLEKHSTDCFHLFNMVSAKAFHYHANLN